MTTIALCAISGAAGFGLGTLLGYGVPKLYRRAIERAVERERVVSALAGGQIPSWERTATELEQAAVAQAKQGMSATSRTLLDQAADVRARGKSGR
jgi:hypothetical protein